YGRFTNSPITSDGDGNHYVYGGVMSEKDFKFFKNEKEKRDGMRALYALALGLVMAVIFTYWLDLGTTGFFVCAGAGAASIYSALLKQQAAQTVIDNQDKKKDA
ncbi:MAG: hypothetical protein ACK529_09540, partial [Alphaproteobacteria bacterium]